MAEFHARASAHDQQLPRKPCDPTPRLDRLGDQIERPEVPSEAKQLLRRSLPVLRARASVAKGRDEQWMRSPADPHPKNFILCNTHLAAIDIQIKHAMPRHAALAIVLLRQLLDAGGDRRRDPVGSPEAQAFWAGYGPEKMDPKIWSFESLFGCARLYVSRFTPKSRFFPREAEAILAAQLADDARLTAAHGRLQGGQTPDSPT